MCPRRLAPSVSVVNSNVKTPRGAKVKSKMQGWNWSERNNNIYRKLYRYQNPSVYFPFFLLFSPETIFRLFFFAGELPFSANCTFTELLAHMFALACGQILRAHTYTILHTYSRVRVVVLSRVPNNFIDLMCERAQFWGERDREGGGYAGQFNEMAGALFCGWFRVKLSAFLVIGVNVTGLLFGRDWKLFFL